MKTQLMMDAINYFNADITVSDYDHIYKRDSSYSALIGYTYNTHNKNYELVCSVAEINELIDELSNWQPTLPEFETVECKGKIYEIGKYYEFSYDCEFNRYEAHKLTGFDPSNLTLKPSFLSTQIAGS